MDDLEYIVVGGQQKQAFGLPQEEYTRFGRGVVVAYDANGGGKVVFDHITPSELYAESNEGSILFKSSSIHGNQLHLCTQTELLSCRLPDFVQTRHLSLPLFNDVHHVVESSDGTLLVAVTGLDMVVRIDTAGTIVEEWDTLGRKTWEKWSRDEDYRLWLTTKPHESHPNFVFEHGSDVWVTRFEQKDAICLTNPAKRIDIGIERPHDGHVSGDKVYFTTVDGHVVIADLVTAKVLQVIDLHACDPDRTHTGWARGLKIIDSNHVMVGFSTLRVTRFRDNVRWIKRRVGMLKNPETSPTHVALYNLERQELVWRRVLDDPKVDVIFSIL